MTEPGTDQSIVIGLDFGTTYSGAAWAIADEQQDIEVVSTWPGGGNRTSVKLPTVVAFSESRVLWGWQALGSSKEPIRGVKLLLDEEQSYRYNPSLRAKKLLSSSGKSPVDVSAEYLQLLGRRFGHAVNDMCKRYVLTVPAVWSDKAKDATMKIAIKAGINELGLTLLSEPEAAALYTLRVIQPNTIKKGDTFIVCDAGGGTVDLIPYRVHDLSSLELEEVVEGTAFELLPERTCTAALRYWRDSIKKEYTGSGFEDDEEEDSWALPLPGLEDRPLIDLEGGFLQLSKSQVHGIFDPVVQDVIKLVQQQVRSIQVKGLSIQAVLLVGGFGECEYLYRRLCIAFPKITIIQPPNAWQAVVSGAVLGGLEGNRVESRLARYHYGLAISVPYKEALHGKSRRFWCPFTECWKVLDVMEWLIEKVRFPESPSIYAVRLLTKTGNLYFRKEPIRNTFSRFAYRDADLKFTERFYYSSSSTAPTRMTDAVKNLCEIQVDLNTVPKQLFGLYMNSKGKAYYKIQFDFVMIPTSGYMYFGQEINGTAYGTARAVY